MPVSDMTAISKNPHEAKDMNMATNQEVVFRGERFCNLTHTTSVSDSVPYP